MAAQEVADTKDKHNLAGRKDKHGSLRDWSQEENKWKQLSKTHSFQRKQRQGGD